MRPGSVIVDLAAETGGNCELTKPGEEIVRERRARSSASLNLPSTMPAHASQLYARNVTALLSTSPPTASSSSTSTTRSPPAPA